MLCVVGEQYKVVGYCLQHNHFFHRAHECCYVRNRNLTTKQKAHVMSVMEIFGNAREVCRRVRENFNRLVTMRDISSLGRKFRLIDGRMNKVLSDYWNRRKWYGLPSLSRIVRHLVGMYSEMLLSDATHQPNRKCSTTEKRLFWI